MSDNIRFLRYISIAITNVVLLSTIAKGQDFLQNTGFSVETFVGHISVYNVEGTQYGLRIGAWPRSWLSVGYETSTANNLWKDSEYYNNFSAQKGEIDFSRSHIFVGFHLRMFDFIHPYILGTYGRSKEPNIGIRREGEPERFYLEKNSVTLKTGLAFEIQRVRLAIETGGGSMGSGHSETNMSLSYTLNQLPKPYRLSNFAVSAGHHNFDVTAGIHNFRAFTGPYKSEEFTGFDFSLEVEKNGRIREYNLGIFFTQGDIYSTGVINIGASWHINNSSKFFDYIDVAPGVQMLIWLEGLDYVLPAASLGLSSQYQLSGLILFVKVRTLATYSRFNGFISGMTATYGVGMAF